jgi:N-acetyl-gamma-glutamyl-phosphate reductase
MNTDSRVAIIGASGYSGEELVRLLLRHPHAELTAVSSRQYAGQSIASVFPKFTGIPGAELLFIPSTTEAIIQSGANTALLALPHGVAHEFAAPLLQAGLNVIDLSADFRIKNINTYAEFYGEAHHAPELCSTSVYGLAEIHTDAIRTASLIACPGCYPTSILLPLIPFLKEGLLDPTSIIVSSMSGVSGAGRNAKLDYLYVECNESVRSYGVPKHRHLAEIEQELSLAAGQPVTISFTPHLIPVHRGFHTTLSALASPNTTAATLEAAWQKAYAHRPFVRILPSPALPDTKNVTGTNFCDIAFRLDPRTGRILILSAEDNLIKGASGQAIQCLNLLNGWDETAGLL